MPDIYTPIDKTSIDQPKTPEYMAELNKYLDLMKKHFSLKFSEGVFAGGILQIAYMGILLFSKNEIIPDSCKEIVDKNDKKVAKFCIGKELYGLPTGLIIYAARNQYCHWDEYPLPTTTKIFSQLHHYFRTNMFTDLSFALTNPGITIYADEILFTALHWTTYRKYISEMRDLLLINKRLADISEGN